MDNINCQSGTPKDNLAIIKMGEVKGNKLKNNDALLSGFSNITPINIKLAIIGREIGRVNWFASCKLSTAEPMAAKNAP